VYRCLEAATDREAACKVILLRDLSTMEVTAIKREVATIKRLKHTRLVRYWRATEVPHKRLSIYMEFVAGGALSGRLRREGALPMTLVKKFTRQLCEALAFLHARGIAHRDIKCANVFLTSAGEDADIKLGDFGAFKETGSASLVGGLKGTPHWMAPEVIRGVPPTADDSTCGNDERDGESWWFRADVWSLGCATLEMLTGQAPWRQYSNPHTAMYQIVTSNNTPTIPADASDEVLLALPDSCLLIALMTVSRCLCSLGRRRRRRSSSGACNAIPQVAQRSQSYSSTRF
jgi:serine/threonine protein kinase